ncbi:MAG TPA: BTAD domain-containing putative transcriptional regulator, partial [Intrasporangium sp.]|nr:BTAD domain-containing putative transcriptional regulator [Intrasporangium sp.]
MSISVLGPLLVDDRPALSPRDQVVLEALVAARGEALSTEKIAEAMWGDSPPVSWPKLIPSSILRIRKAVGSPAVSTTRHGYRLALNGDGVDAYRFERLVARGHQFLRQGEADRAVHALREALALWRGRPLAELETWEPGRFEAERLNAMRREAEEAVLDATLRIGLHAEAVPEARARVAEEPLRERRWALLARAQYLSGDQADALATLRQARRHLAEELGLDPGAELAELEQAVLRQDASLVAATALPEPLAANPYPGLRAFDVDEGEFFFGREAETVECLRRLDETRVLVVVGPSGSGKSSLARAGVMASLQRDRRPVELVGVGPDPVEAVRQASGSAPGGTLVVDQLEELIAAVGDREKDELFAGFVEQARAGRLVLTIRADRLGELSGHSELARLIERGLYLLGPLDEAALRLAIVGPAGEAGLVVESGLVDLLIGEVLEEPGALPLMAHALHQTWESREGRTLTVDGYRASGGIRGAVARSAELVYEGLTEAERSTLHDLLLRLVSVAPDGEPVRNWVPARQLTPGEGQNLVEVLIRARLVTVDDGVAALAHESLARAWPRLKGWLEDDLEGQRILRHLAGAADSWDTLGRPDSELYRGVRLARALDWRRRSATVLTPTETEFLHASERLDAEDRSREEVAARHRRRQAMRTRGLVAGLTTFALVAGIAAAFGVRERDRAAEAAAVARARAATVVAHESTDPTVAALAGVEAVRLRDGSDTRGALLSALTRWPTLLASTDLPEGYDLAVDPSGVLAIAHGGHISLRDPTSLAEVDRLPGDADAVAFLSDGRRVVAGSEGGALGIIDRTTGERHEVPHGANGVWRVEASLTGDVLAAFLWSRSDDSSAVHVWRGTTHLWALPPGPVRDLGLSPDGSRLYLALDGATLEAYDVVSGQRVAKVAFDDPGGSGAPPELGALEVARDGASLAVGGEQVLLLDASTL